MALRILKRKASDSFMLPSWRVGLLLAGLANCALGQWLNYPETQTPRTKDGKPNLSARAPRTSDGKPDLSGVWRTEFAQPGEHSDVFDIPGDHPSEFSKYFYNVLSDFKSEQGLLRPEAAEIMRKTRAIPGDSPQSRCLPMSIPAVETISYTPIKIIQARSEIVIIYELDSTLRQIYTDARKLPKDPQPSWMGYSVGRWEGDTLVVDTAGFNDKSPLDGSGHPRSEALHLTERFHRRDFGHMDLQFTIDDSKMYTKPFTFHVTEILEPDSDVLETICNENERDRAHLPGK